MSIVKVRSVSSVHFRRVRGHQIKKKHHMWFLLVKVFAESKSFPGSGETQHGKPSTDEEVEKLKTESYT